LCRRQVDLVQHRNDLEDVLQSEVQVGQCLRLDSLGGVHQQDRSLAGGEAAADLVGEVDVARCVDQVQHVGGVVRGDVGQSHGLTLDGDAALAFDVHPIEVLRAHAAFVEDTRELQHPIGQCR